MAKINSERFQHFVESVKNQKDLVSRHIALRKAAMGGDQISSKELESVDVHIKDRLQEECVIEYVKNLEAGNEIKSEYFRDIRTAASEDNLYMLDILIGVTLFLPILNKEIDNFLLSYFVGFFEKSNDQDLNYYAQYLFEQVMDTAEKNENEYTSFIERIFSLKKASDWYREFNSAITKLLYKAPLGNETQMAVRRGLTEVPESTRRILQDYLKDTSR